MYSYTFQAVLWDFFHQQVSCKNACGVSPVWFSMIFSLKLGLKHHKNDATVGHLHVCACKVAQFFFWRADNCFGKFKVHGLSFRSKKFMKDQWIPNTPRVLSFGPSKKKFGRFFFGWFSGKFRMKWDGRFSSRLVEYYSIWSGIFVDLHSQK